MVQRGRQREAGTQRSEARDRLLDAAEEVLRDEGFLGASARTIAERAGVAPGGIHYHFASVDALLLEAFDRATSARRDEYERLAADATDLPTLLAATAKAFEADREAGRFRLLAELMAGAAGGGAMAAEVADRTEPWVGLTEETITRFLGAAPFGGLVDARDLAVAVVALFVGLELIDQLDPDRFDTSGLLEGASSLAALLVGGPE